jgi:methionine aminopeptidase
VIVCKSEREIKIMREAGRIVAEALSITKEIAKEDVTTEELNTRLENMYYRKVESLFLKVIEVILKVYAHPLMKR